VEENEGEEQCSKGREEEGAWWRRHMKWRETGDTWEKRVNKNRNVRVWV